MTETKLISPLLDHFAVGDPICDRNGVRSCPAMDQQTEEKYIVKIISVPASPAQLDAMLLTGAYTDRAQALTYYKTLAKEIMDEVETLNKIATMDGFVGYAGSQLIECEDENGYEVYLLSPYRKTLERHWAKNAPTHLEALNLGLDLCSALSVCRRSGYLYVATKPENIYMIEDKGFRIGDIGLISLDNLKWASLPDRYQSAYMAPELSDPLAPINSTIDVYAVGLILYQAFNGGQLPEQNGSALPAPEFADYEMAEIILKACALNPDDRYHDPVEMGQALVGYMQRNGAHDTPIVPVPVEIPEAEVSADEEIIEESVDSLVESKDTTESVAREQTPEVVQEEIIPDETLPSEETADSDYTQVSTEVLDMLSQADELIAHPAPEPAIAPDPIDVQLPVIDEAQEDAQTEADENAAPPCTLEGETSEAELQAAVAAEQQTVSSENTTEEQDNEDYADDEFFDYEEKPKHHWIRNALLLLLAACIIAAGALFYKFIYQQHIDSLKLYGEDFSLTVHVNTSTDETLLNVVCYDTYGNLLQSPVVDGKAYFEDLAPDCAYTVKVMISGFHSLTGQIASSYSTPQKTTVTQFTAVTGAEDGSAVLNFAIEGPDVDSWIIRRTSEGEEPVDTTITEHTLTVTGLEVGKKYSFELLPGQSRQIDGTTTVMHTASVLIAPQNAAITSCFEGKLSLSWSAPADIQVTNWNVRCFNEKGYDQTLQVAENCATFEGIVANHPYTVEIIADGMSVGQKLYVPENAVTISGFAVTNTNSTSITLSWTNGSNVPSNGWILQYSIDGSATKEVKSTESNCVVLTPYIPDAVYSFTLLTADSLDVVGGKLTYETKKAEDFSGYTVKRSNLIFKMVRTPSVANWTKSNLASSDYTTVFKSIQKASFLVQVNKTYGVSSNKIYITYVIRDEAGKVVNFSTTESKWRNMWNKGYGEFDLPDLPEELGYYTVTVYFNNAIAGQQKFRIKG